VLEKILKLSGGGWDFLPDSGKRQGIHGGVKRYNGFSLEKIIKT